MHMLGNRSPNKRKALYCRVSLHKNLVEQTMRQIYSMVRLKKKHRMRLTRGGGSHGKHSKL
uniref:Uncharacterized protein n=1 Tax=Arundo donax TaxID=35708 RepID=A0A0A9GXT2_ARUDO